MPTSKLLGSLCELSSLRLGQSSCTISADTWMHVMCRVAPKLAPLPTHSYGRDWRVRSRRKKNTAGMHTRELLVAQRCVHRLIAVARGDAPATLLSKISSHSNVVREVLELSERQYAQAMNDPAQCAPLWRDRLRKAQEKQKRAQISCWRRKLAYAQGRPTRALYRWLKQGGTRGHFVVRSGGRAHHGPKAFFQQHRAYWTSLTHRATEEAVDALTTTAHTTAHNFQDITTGDQDTLLYEAIRSQNHWSSSGLDMWPPEVIRLLPREACPSLRHLYAISERTGVWPEPLLDIRLQLLPKDSSTAPSVEAFRPISVCSAWYRLWSAWRLRCLPREVWTTIHPTQQGGLAGRNAAASLLHMMLMIEHASSYPENGLGIISLDAVKCFDKLSYGETLRCAQAIHVPFSVLKALLGFWTDSVRYLSANSALDLQGFSCSNGIPQGCALSVLMCVAMVHSWTSSVLRVKGVGALSYIDDRYLHSHSPPALQEAWVSSQDWEEVHKWELNPSKSGVVIAGTFNGKFAKDEVPLAQQNTLKALGVEMPVHCNAPVKLTQKRIEAATSMAHRVALLRLPIPLTQQLIQTIVMPRAVYQIVPRLPRVDMLKRLQAGIKQALQLQFRRVSWHAVCACIWKGHHVHPLYAQYYVHARTVCLARRQSREVAQIWSEVAVVVPRKPTRGPYGVWCELLRKLQVSENEAGELIHPRVPSVNLQSSDWPRVKKFWALVIRHALFREAEERRPNLKGLLGSTEVEVTMRILANRHHPLRSELINLTCDGLWCRKIRAKFGEGGPATCEHCDSGVVEDPQHVLLDCPRWKHMRNWTSDTELVLRAGPAATRHCFHAPVGMSNAQQKQWFKVQEAGARIFQARNKNQAPSTPSGGPGVQLEPREGASWVPFRFRLTYSLRGVTGRWNYPRTEWHRLTRFIASLGVWEREPPNYRWPSVCDLLLSFLLMNGRERFCDGMPEDWRGGWIGTQIETLVYAVRLFQDLTGCDKLVPEPNTKTSYCSWAAKHGMPDFKLLLLPIRLPNLAEVERLFREGVAHISDMRVQQPEATGGWWRKWRPGRDGSQLVSRGRISPLPLVMDPPRKLHKNDPPWKSQILQNHQWWKPVRTAAAYRNLLPSGLPIGDRLVTYGVLARAEIKGFQVQQRCIASRAASLLAHNRVAALKSQHRAASATYFRPACYACQQVGPLGFKQSWFTGRCQANPTLELDQIASYVLSREEREANTAAQLAGKLVPLFA